MQKSLIRRNIEEHVLERHMAVNSIAMIVRLLFLLGENNTSEIKTCINDIRVKSLVWLISYQVFTFSIINVKSQLDVLKLAKIEIWDNFESSESILKNLLVLLKGNRTTSLMELVNIGIQSVISSVLRLIQPFSIGYERDISMGSLYDEIIEKTLKCVYCQKDYFIKDLKDELLTDDISTFVCYNCIKVSD